MSNFFTDFFKRKVEVVEVTPSLKLEGYILEVQRSFDDGRTWRGWEPDWKHKLYKDEKLVNRVAKEKTTPMEKYRGMPLYRKIELKKK